MGGTLVRDLSGTTGAAVVPTDMPTTTREGYAFGGWYDNAEYQGDAATQLPERFEPGIKTYWAKWTAQPASVTFDPAGGAFAEGTEGVGADGKLAWIGTTGAALPSKALPAAPARVTSTEAFRARMFVCNAISSIVSIIWLISFVDVMIRFIA